MTNMPTRIKRSVGRPTAPSSGVPGVFALHQGQLDPRRGCQQSVRPLFLFGGDARSWLNLQTAYDLRKAEQADAKRIEREVVPDG